MTTETRQMSVRKRLDELESHLAATRNQVTELVKALGQVLENNSRELSNAVETLNAVVASIGAEEIAELVVAERKVKADKDAQEKKAALEAMVADGTLAPATVISERSVVTGRELDLDGKEVAAYTQVQISSLKPEFKAQLLGQSVSFVLTTPGGKLEVQGVFDFVPKTPAEVIPPPAKPAVVHDDIEDAEIVAETPATNS